MSDTLTLDYFKLPADRQYHIYRIHSSELDGAPHSHEYFHVCYVSGGTVLHTMLGETVTLGYGDAFVVPPGVSHSLSFSPDGEGEIYSLSYSMKLFHSGFSQSHLSRFLTALQLPDKVESRALRCRISLNAEQRLTMNAVLESLIRESEANYPPEQSAAPSLIASALYVMSQAYAASPEQAETLQAAGRYTDSLEACIRYIDRFYHLPLTAEDLCRRFAMSRSTFSLLFPQVAGMPLKRYITQKRIGQAALLADTTELSFSEIADIVGYDDFSTFYRNFVKVTGLSPSVYREQQKNRLP